MKKHVTLKEASTVLGVSTQTLRRYEDEGRLTCIRTEGGHRRVPMSELERLLGERPVEPFISIIYTRCSTAKQKTNLAEQENRLIKYCEDNDKTYELFSEIGSGLNGNRPKLQSLLKRIAKGDVLEVIVEYEDRLTRFGFPYFVTMFETHGVKTVVLDERKDKSFEEELVEDILKMITVSSAKMYGKRGAENKRKKALERQEELGEFL